MATRTNLVSTPRIDFSKPIDKSAVKGNSVLITGGAAGLGLAMARSLAQAGAKVAIADLNSEAGEAAVKELTDEKLEVIFVKTDVTSWDSQLAAFKKTIAHFGTLDTVIPNAGLTGGRIDDAALPKDLPPDADPPEPSIAAIQVNATGVYYSTVLALHYFTKLSAKAATSSSTLPKKHLLFVASLAGYIDQPLVSIYGLSKWGVRGLYRSLRLSGDAFGGVRMNLIAPTYIETTMIKHVAAHLRAGGLYVGVPEDAAQACMRLCCDESIDTLSGKDAGDGTPGSANIDLGDDYEGGSASEQIQDAFIRELFGKDDGLKNFFKLHKKGESSE